MVALLFTHNSPVELPALPAGTALGALAPTCTGPTFTTAPALSFRNSPGVPEAVLIASWPSASPEAVGRLLAVDERRCLTVEAIVMEAEPKRRH
jgi:hypothetical protein